MPPNAQSRQSGLPAPPGLRPALLLRGSGRRCASRAVTSPLLPRSFYPRGQLSLIEVYLDPGLPLSCERVASASFHEMASRNTPQARVGPVVGFGQLEAKDNTSRWSTKWRDHEQEDLSSATVVGPPGGFGSSIANRQS